MYKAHKHIQNIQPYTKLTTI